MLVHRVSGRGWRQWLCEGPSRHMALARLRLRILVFSFAMAATSLSATITMSSWLNVATTPARGMIRIQLG